MNYHKLMQDLQREYIENLPERIQEIQSSWNNEDTNQLIENFHKLKGTGKTYGLPEVSTLGATLEKVGHSQPEALTKLVPEAIDLLHAIHSQRQSAQSFDLSEDNRFHRIQAFAQNAPDAV